MIMSINNDQFNELKKCENNILYFANKYIKISDNTSARQINLNDFQRSVVDKFQSSKSFFLSANRMDGKTTVAAIILLHCALFNNKNSSVVFAPKQIMSDHILELITEMYERLPNFLTISKLTLKSKHRIEFDNDSFILSAGSNAESVIGIDISTMYVDESEYVADDFNSTLAKLAIQFASKASFKMFILSSNKSAEIIKSLESI